jgi:KDO2-lipid IV(A) lauroyltransferase
MSLLKLLSYSLLRALTFPFSLLSYTQIHAIGKKLGTALYYLFPKFRKRALSNLALASDLQLNEKEIIQFAKESFQNLAITCLEYAKLANEKDISRIARCENPEIADQLMAQGKNVIFFCGHQANWELLFLEGTSRMPGVAIGRPIKNGKLYNWILNIRQKFGGKIITPKNAFREGLKALKSGSFLGIVGDQGMPDSGFSSSFLGRRAWTSPLPAILAYRTGKPLMVATTKRQDGKYLIHYSEPLWADLSQSMEKEIERLMGKCLSLLEASIRENPGQWLWQHNRWKQQTPEKLKRKFRHETIAIILPHQKNSFDEIISHLPLFRELYPYEFITLFVPKEFAEAEKLEEWEVHPYEKEEDLHVRDFSYKLIFNFSVFTSVGSHFLSLGAFEVINFADLQEEANDNSSNFSHILKAAISHAT